MRALACTIVVLVLVACGGSDEGARAVIETDSGDVLVHVEVANTAAERERGLMDRRELAADSGMAFVFPEDTTASFWMKDTLIPLSIAFYDDAGRIVRILDMQPCRADPCPLYDPEVPYRGALEVNRGAFRSWGVRVGDGLRVIGND
jgi:uncharacterized membrane protein (UPF0127 family)